ncbi:MAG: hypothetical protein AAF614_39295 [Chloroflexota bacterium]
MTTPTHHEEAFGILTDDQLYIDCALFRPAKTPETQLSGLRVWVPKYPLTKESVAACARHQVKSAGPMGHVAHLVFDLRGTGYSDGLEGDFHFNRDFQAIHDWAKERFHSDINVGFLGRPLLTNGRVYMWPLSGNSQIESYYYPPNTRKLSQPCLLYMASYGHFTKEDDAICHAFSQMNFAVYGLDPLRYLLHASSTAPLLPQDLERDMNQLIQMLPSKPIIIARPLAAGLGIMWTAKVEAVQGIISIGSAQRGLKAKHIFHNHNPHTYLLARYARRIAPRPFVIVQHEGHPLGGKDDEVGMLMHSSLSPHRLERTRKITVRFLDPLIQWIQSGGV